MMISYCLNPSCKKTKNDSNLKFCQNCGSSLILHNRYRIVKKIGKGGFGATFLAMDLSLPGNPLCVVKQLRPSSDDEDVLEMSLNLFEREARTLGKIDHPQIPRLLDYFQDNQQFYLVQSLVTGKNLQQEVKQKGVFSESLAKRFLVEMLPVMKYIHGIKIIHRDIKPANIIRREQDGQLVLIDFGAVKDQVNTQLAKNYGQTAFTQFSIGTVGFAPPEQLAMRPVYSSDLYALGATCLFLMTAKSPKDIPCDDLTGELLWEQEVKISPSFARVLGKMLEVDLRNRYKRAEEVMDDLDIAPYEEELQKSLTGKNPAPELPNSQDSDDSTASTGYTSATKKLAMAIRARKARRNEGKIIIEVNPETILSAYSKGKTNFSGQNLSKLHLPRENLSGCNFRHSQLKRVNFQETNLSKSNFYNANLSKSNLHKANLQDAHLVKTDLQYTHLEGADLQNADLTHANLKRTNLCGANLTNAKVEKEQLAEAKTNWSTIFPDGKRKLW